MATHAAIAAVSRTLRTLLLDRMVIPASVSLAPPDVTVDGIDGARVNLYLMQLIENAGLKNQEIPGSGHPAAYGHPPLSLNLRYLVTTHSAMETQPDADLNAQTLLGDAMRVFNDFGNRLDNLTIVNPAAGAVGDPLLDPVLEDEFERLRIVLHPATLDDITKVWSAISATNFRRSVVYEVTVVQIETPQPRVRPQPVETRRILMTVRRQPEILDAYVTPALNGPIGEIRARIGDEITILAEGTLADRLHVRFGTLEPIRVSPPADGRIRIILPDAQYPADLDNPLPRPIPPEQRLQPGPVEVQVIAGHPADGVGGGLGHGAVITTHAPLPVQPGAAAALPAHHLCRASRRQYLDHLAGERRTPVAPASPHRRSDRGRRGHPGPGAATGRSLGGPYADGGRSSNECGGGDSGRFGDALSGGGAG